MISTAESDYALQFEFDLIHFQKSRIKQESNPAPKPTVAVIGLKGSFTVAVNVHH